MYIKKKTKKYGYKKGGQKITKEEDFLKLSNEFLNKDNNIKNKQFTEDQKKEIMDLIKNETIKTTVMIRTELNDLRYSYIVLKKYLNKILPNFDEKQLDKELSESEMKKYVRNIKEFNNYKILKNKKTYLKA